MRKYMLTLLMLILSSSLAAAGEAAAPAERQYYVIQMELELDENPTPEQQQAMVSHVAHLNELYASGALFMGGPFMDEGNEGHQGICIVEAGSAAEARALAEADPSVQAGIMHIRGVHQWWAAFDRHKGVTFSVAEMTGMVADKTTGADAAGSASGIAAPTTELATAAADTAEVPQMAIGGSNFIEYPSTDLASTEEFYGNLFGWTFDRMDMGDGSEFAFFAAPGGLSGAFTTMYKPSTDGPVMYINCDGVAATLERIKQAGGAVTMDTMVLPMDMGYIGQFTDPSGNLLGLWSMAP